MAQQAPTTVHVNANSTNTQTVPVPGSTSGENITITPLGSGREVGRSCILVKFSGHTVMLDCGMHPARNGYDSLPQFDNFDMASVDVCLVTHFHLDHCGALPYLCEQTGFAGRIFMTHPTHAFFNMVMADLIKINSPGTSDVIRDEWLQSTLNRVERISYHQEIRHHGIRFQALNAGHVLGAAMFLVEIAGIRILYTGDYSRVPDRHLLAAELPPVAPDILIVESTYGILEHKSTEERENLFVSTAVSIVRNGGRCLVPVFALGRAQELLLILEEHWDANPELHEIPVYFASSIANPCIGQYKTFAATAMNDHVQKQLEKDVNPFDFKYVKYLPDMRKFDDRGPCVVLASPGMLQSGLSRQLFEKWCNRPQNGIIVAGYCIDGTIADQVKRGARQIEVEDGRVLHVNMQHRLEVSFSAHADVRQTTEFISALPATKHVVLVHGSPMAVDNLEKRLSDTFKKSRGLNVYKPGVEESVHIKFERQRSATLLGSLATRAAELVSNNEQNNNSSSNNSLIKKPNNNTISAQALVTSVGVEGVAIQAEDHQLAVVAPEEVSNFSDISLCRDFQQAVVIPMATFRTPQEISNILNSYYANAAWIDRSAFFGTKQKNNKTNSNNNVDDAAAADGQDENGENRRRGRDQNNNNNENAGTSEQDRLLFSVIPLRQHNNNNNDGDREDDENNHNKENDDDVFDTTKQTNDQQQQVNVSELRVNKDVRVIIHEDASNGTTTVTVRWRSHRKSDIMADVIIAALLLCDSNSLSNDQQNNNNKKSSSAFGNNNTNNNRNGQQDDSTTTGKENERLQPADTENMAFRYQCFHRMLRQHFPSVRVNLRDGTAMIVVPSPKNNGQKWHVEIQDWLLPRVIEEEQEEQETENNNSNANNNIKNRMPDSMKRRIGYTLQRIYLAINPIPFDDKVNAAELGLDAAVGGGSQLLEGGGWCRCGGH